MSETFDFLLLWRVQFDLDVVQGVCVFLPRNIQTSLYILIQQSTNRYFCLFSCYMLSLFPSFIILLHLSRHRLSQSLYHSICVSVSRLHLSIISTKLPTLLLTQFWPLVLRAQTTINHRLYLSAQLLTTFK